MDLKEIRTLIDLMKKNGLSVFKMEREGFKITLKTGATDSAAQINVVSPTHAPAARSIESPAETSHHKEIKSPMVGTFYAAPSPEAAPYVTVGKEVTPDTVVCIIEAMKVMNEIKAETSGVIAEVCAQNGKPVQFGQALFRVK
ncbi:MAG TPA: acetyl-CoA carboxylase biotin carboxyl carrier protein [Terrimicrobiaceae bacterium]